MVLSISGIYSASLHSSLQPLCLFSLIVFLRLLQQGARAGSLVRWQKLRATEARVKTTESVCSLSSEPGVSSESMAGLFVLGLWPLLRTRVPYGRQILQWLLSGISLCFWPPKGQSLGELPKGVKDSVAPFSSTSTCHLLLPQMTTQAHLLRNKLGLRKWHAMYACTCSTHTF